MKNHLFSKNPDVFYYSGHFTTFRKIDHFDTFIFFLFWMEALLQQFRLFSKSSLQKSIPKSGLLCWILEFALAKLTVLNLFTRNLQVWNFVRLQPCGMAVGVRLFEGVDDYFPELWVLCIALSNSQQIQFDCYWYWKSCDFLWQNVRNLMNYE